jgi:hypothetical protein
VTDPITPPPELVQQWLKERTLLESQPLAHTYLAARAAQWGADTELEACCNWVAVESIAAATELRSWRRPKPPSLKQQALTALYAVATGANDTREQHQDLDTIRRALEALPE